MIRKIAALAAAASFSSTGHCIDGIALEYGRGDDRTNLLRISVMEKWRGDEPPNPPQWRLAGHWEFSLALWDNATESTGDLGFAPVFRMERGAWYVEGALGLHLVQTHVSAERTFSTSWQFAEHVGAGMRAGKYVYGLHAQHLSNGGIRKPNPGINFLLLRVHYELE